MKAPLLLLILMSAALGACRRGPSDEALVREEFGVPPSAELVSLEAEPKNEGTFGREGLRVAAQFELAAEDADKAARAFRDGGRWRRSFDLTSVQSLPGFPGEGFGGVRPSLVYCWVTAQEAGGPAELPCDLAPPKVLRLRYAVFDPQAGKLAAVLKNYY